jgi:hypothetical protein
MPTATAHKGMNTGITAQITPPAKNGAERVHRRYARNFMYFSFVMILIAYKL